MVTRDGNREKASANLRERQDSRGLHSLQFQLDLVNQELAAVFLGVSVSTLKSWRVSGCYLRLLKTRTAQYGSALRRLKGNGGRRSASRANDLSLLDILLCGGVSLSFATFTELGIVGELLLVEEELLSSRENEVGMTVRAFQNPVDESHWLLSVLT